MSSISISKHYNELDDYTQIADYISRVLNNFNDIEKADANDVYELVYAKKLCESKLKQGIENDITRKAYEDTLTRITLITNLLNDDIISSIMKNPLDMQKVKKINESRHSKLNKSPKIKDKSKPITDSPIKAYMNKILPKIIMMALFVIVLIFSDDIGNAITSALVSASASTNTPEVTPKEILPIHTVINIVAMIFVLASTLGLTLDLMYIAFPFLRDMMDRNKSADSTSFVSDIAKDAVTYSGSIIGYDYSDVSNKVSYSSNLLNTILDKLKNNNDRGNKTIESHIGYLTKLRNKVKDSKKDIDKINYLADAEVYYLNNKEYFNELLGDEAL